jgi:hypothetical protein
MGGSTSAGVATLMQVQCTRLPAPWEEEMIQPIRLGPAKPLSQTDHYKSIHLHTWIDNPTGHCFACST